MSKIPIHIAVVEHMSGVDVFTSTTEAGMQRKVADYCRSHWLTADWSTRDKPEAPADDAQCVIDYFEGHDHDTLTTHCDSVEML